MHCRLAIYSRSRKDLMAGFLAAMKKAGKSIGRFEKKRYQQKLGIKPSAGTAGSDPVADAAQADAKDRKKARAKTRE